MTSSVRMTFGAVAAWIGIASAAAASEMAPPDSAERTELRERLGNAGMVRVLGQFGAREVPHPLLDSIGILSADWLKIPHQRPALVVGARVPPQRAPAAIVWSDVDEVQLGRSSTGRGLLIGVLSGLVVSSLEVVAVQGSQSEAALGLLGAVIATPIFTGFVGAAIGASHARWRTVYRSHA